MNNKLLVAARFTYPEYEWGPDKDKAYRVIPTSHSWVDEKIYFNPTENNDDLMALIKAIARKCVRKNEKRADCDTPLPKYSCDNLCGALNLVINLGNGDIDEIIKAACVLEGL